MRSALRYLLSSLLVGVLSVGLAWAGSGLVPVSSDQPDLPELMQQADDDPEDGPDHGEEQGTPEWQGELGQGLILAGASKVSIEPQPGEGDVWERDRAKCATLGPDFVSQLPDSASHLASTGSPWNENPNCIYMGGYGIGPMNPITEWDQEFGLWVRSVALQGPNGGALVMTIIDGEGYLWDYANKCSDCGIKQLSQSLGDELGIPAESFVMAATHSHTAPDFLGGWGHVPDWYMTQVTEAIRTSVREAWSSRQPAVLETGETLARPFNSERRDTYRSAEEQQLTWLRAVEARGNGNGNATNGGRTIATVGAFAAHPVTADEGSGVGHADWPGVFAHSLEERFGGVGLHFMTGLGNISPRHPFGAEGEGGWMMGRDLASLIPDVGDGLQLETTDIRISRTTWNHPTTNVPLTALGAPGFFDRRFVMAPAEVRTGKSPDTAPCESAAPVSVELPVSAARIGDRFALTAAPGEIFSNVSNTIKEKSGALITMPLGQANDALGYMPQSFELNPVGQQGLGFVAGGFVIVNYEDSYAIDRCVGDKVLEESLSLLNQLP